MGSLHLKRTFDIVDIVLNDKFSDFNSTQLLCTEYYGINTQLRHEWNVLAALDPSTRISLSVIEFTPVETKGGNLGSSRAGCPFQIFRQFDILCIYVGKTIYDPVRSTP